MASAGETCPTIRPLLPPGPTRPLAGLYLDQGLRDRPGPLVYTNFIASLDGRIALGNDGGDSGVPRAITNGADLRLYRELIAQADAVVVPGRHLREGLNRGRRPWRLLREDRDGDLLAWRRARGLPAQPALVAVTTDLALPPLPEEARGAVHVLAWGGLRGGDLRAAEEAGYRVRHWPDSPGIDAALLAGHLAGEGLPLLCSVAGPAVLRALLAAGRLDRLYLTVVTRLLGGADYATLLEGSALASPAGLRLGELYLDRSSFADASQLFAVLDPSARG